MKFALMIISFLSLLIGATGGVRLPKLPAMANKKSLPQVEKKAIVYNIVKEPPDNSTTYNLSPKSLDELKGSVTIDYIKKYAQIAKKEQARTGVLASITLGQAIIESNSGRSILTKKFNNHFGIKAKGNQPYAVYADDTPTDKFRTFRTDEESFIAHSNLLINDRYSIMSKCKDYTCAAFAVKSLGYASDPKYSSKLIAVIEKYKLYEMDEQK